MPLVWKYTFVIKSPLMKTVSFKTIGCRLNQAETAQMAASLETAGWSVVPFGDAVDACVIHTCAVTAKAEQTCARYARVARKQGARTVILAGCAAEVDGKNLKARSAADLILSQTDKYNIAELLERGRSRPESASVPRFDTKRAIIKVQDGCDFGCAYCIVPSTRSTKYSRPVAEVVEEVRKVADRGYKEFVLTGANLGCFSDNGRGLARLVEAVEQIPGVKRIRLSSVELSTVEREIIEFMAGSTKLCHFLHVPLQSGDDRILAAMGRRYDIKQYLAFVDFALGKIPLLGLGTDIIVGFPGEDTAAFENSRHVLERVPFNNVHVFPYSRRPGTKAAGMRPEVQAPETRRRAAELLVLAERKKVEFARQFVGNNVSVLVENVDRKGIASGWTGEYVEAKVNAAGITVNQIVGFVPSACEPDGTLSGQN